MLALVSSVLELAPFYFLYRAILVVAEGGEGAQLVTFGILAGVAAALQTVTWSGAMYVSHVAAYDQLHELRVELLNRLTRLPLGEVTGRHSGDLQRVVVDDVGKLELFVAHSFVEFVSAAVSWVIVTTWLAVVDYRLAAATAVVAAVAYAILLVGTRKSGEAIAETNAASGRLSRKLVEFLDGLLTTAVLDRSERPSRKLRSAVTDLADANARWYGRVDPHAAAYHVLNDAAILLVIPIGGVLLLRGGVEAGHLLLFAILGLGYGIPIQRLRRIYFLANKISYAAGVVDETLEAEIQPDAPGPAPSHTSDLEFEDVCFGYDEREVLSGVSFRAPSGTLTAIVGQTGAGKSTLARLAARFWDVGSGSVRLGGIDVRDLPIDHLLSRVAFVFQDTFLFRDTIEANLRVGRPAATEEEVGRSDEGRQHSLGHLRHAGRLPDPARYAWRQPLRRREATAGHSPGAAARCAAGDPGRSDGVRRPGQRGGAQRLPARPHGGSHRPGGRPPAVDHRGSGPDPGPGGREDRSGRGPRRPRGG